MKRSGAGSSLPGGGTTGKGGILLATPRGTRGARTAARPLDRLPTRFHTRRQRRLHIDQPAPGRERKRTMRRASWLILVILAVAGAAALPADPALGQTKKLVYWTLWDQNPDFTKWYETRGKDFAKKFGYEVEVVTVPYQGYEPKYLAALMGKSGAPDLFMGMTHQWCWQYDFCDKMPADIEKTWDENLPKYMVPIGKW